jgi:hypothetical protein
MLGKANRCHELSRLRALPEPAASGCPTTVVRTVRDIARTYTDIALTPVGDDEDMTLDLLNNTTGANAAVAHLRKVAALTGTARVA